VLVVSEKKRSCHEGDPVSDSEGGMEQRGRDGQGGHHRPPSVLSSSSCRPVQWSHSKLSNT
jgi:hypothetical protein